MPETVVLSVQVGRPRCFDTADDAKRPWTSGIIKTRVTDPVYVGPTNLVGDEQADLVHHGGVDKAVLVYPAGHYEFWRDEFPEIDWQAGSFGENLTLSTACESEVCVGDVFQLGACVLEVSQPRQPCWKLSKRWGIPKLAVRVQQTRRTGWYLRVREPGEIQVGQAMTLVDRPYERWTIQRANEVMFGQPRDHAAGQSLAECPALSQSWKTTLTQRSTRQSADASKTQTRLTGR